MSAVALWDLPARWRSEAALLRDYGAEEAAKATERHARELEEALRAAQDELLTPDEASEASGLSKRTLRGLVQKGGLENHGRSGAPLYCRGELPKGGMRKAGTGFDPAQEARQILGGSP